MPLKNLILSEDWTDYELRKLRFGGLVVSFDPMVGWEVNYLVEKFAKHRPDLDRMAIKISINTYAQCNKGPYRRDHVVDWVLKRLSL